MKRIAAAAALVLAIGSVDPVDAGCGKCGTNTDHAETHHSEGAEANHPQISPAAQCAIGTFSKLGEQRATLVSKSQGGCEKSHMTLMSDELESIQSMIEALEDEESLKLIKLGMMLAQGMELELGEADGPDGKNAIQGFSNPQEATEPIPGDAHIEIPAEAQDRIDDALVSVKDHLKEQLVLRDDQSTQP